MSTLLPPPLYAYPALIRYTAAITASTAVGGTSCAITRSTQSTAATGFSPKATSAATASRDKARVCAMADALGDGAATALADAFLPGISAGTGETCASAPPKNRSTLSESSSTMDSDIFLPI